MMKDIQCRSWSVDDCDHWKMNAVDIILEGASSSSTVKSLLVNLLCCICSDASIHLDLVIIHQSASNNHGHSWMPSRSLLAVAETSSSYVHIRGNKDVVKARICSCCHFSVCEQWMIVVTIYSGNSSGMIKVMKCISVNVCASVCALNGKQLSYQHQNTSR